MPSVPTMPPRAGSSIAGLECHRTIGAVQTRIPEIVNRDSQNSLYSFQLWRIGLGEVVFLIPTPFGASMPCRAGSSKPTFGSPSVFIFGFAETKIFSFSQNFQSKIIVLVPNCSGNHGFSPPQGKFFCIFGL